MDLEIEKKLLFLQLQRMYWIETQMEQLIEWEAKIELQWDYSKDLGSLSHDSDRHGLLLETWMEKLGVPLPTEPPKGLPTKLFDFKDSGYQAIFSEIMKFEIFSRDTYNSIAQLDDEILDGIFDKKEDRIEFQHMMSYLVSEEERHREICDKKVGGYSTIITSSR